MGQVGLLGLIEIDEQSSAGPDRGLRLAGKVLQAGAELLPGRLHGPVGGEILLPAQLTAAVQPEAQEFPQLHILPGGRVQHRLPGGEAPQLVEEVLLPVPPRKGGGGHLAGGDVAEACPRAGPGPADGGDEIVLPLLQHGGVDHGTGGDDADDIPVHQPLGQGRVLHLLADGHLVPLGDEPGQIGLHRVVGHAAHGGALLGGLVPVPGGEGEVQLLGHQLGVLVEHLIKVAQPEHQDAVGVLRLHLIVLLHHGGQLSHALFSFFRICAGAERPADQSAGSPKRAQVEAPVIFSRT